MRPPLATWPQRRRGVRLDHFRLRLFSDGCVILAPARRLTVTYTTEQRFLLAFSLSAGEMTTGRVGQPPVSARLTPPLLPPTGPTSRRCRANSNSSKQRRSPGRREILPSVQNRSRDRPARTRQHGAAGAAAVSNRLPAAGPLSAGPVT